MILRERMAKRLRRLRESRGLSQTALASKAGVSREYLWRLENGRQDPTLAVLEKLSKALRVKVSRLVD
jgi:transcriptional regulator with XRE-family HTH domain